MGKVKELFQQMREQEIDNQFINEHFFFCTLRDEDSDDSKINKQNKRLMSRNMRYLHSNKIIYRRGPINDQPSETFE